jgi:signal transduction histidine kinase
MGKNPFRAVGKSIFLKLLLVFVVAGAAEIGAMHTFQRFVLFSGDRRMHRYQSMVEYGQLLAASLGPHPARQKVEDLAHRLHMQIRIEAPDYTLSTSAALPSLAEVAAKATPRYSDQNSKVGKFRDYLSIDVPYDHAHYLFLLESEDALERHSQLILALMVGMLFVLFTTYLWIRWILRPLRTLEKGVQEVALGRFDISIPVESRDELGRLVQSFNRMTDRVRTILKSKEQLLLDVSHEFRSPLARIRVALELKSEAAHSSIRRASQELETMVTELLESARLDDAQGKLRLETVDLMLILDDLVSRYEGIHPGMVLLPGFGPVRLAVDVARICTALQNLMENALKYSSHQNRPVEVSVARLGADTVRVSVKDYGLGIALDEQSLLFEPFYRVDRSRVKTTGGYGLGLSLCKKIITAHRGEIHVLSVPGKDTVFQVDLRVH